MTDAELWELGQEMRAANTRPKVIVTGGDYAYPGTLLSVFHKIDKYGDVGPVRCVVQDPFKRLLIHNASQIALAL